MIEPREIKVVKRADYDTIERNKWARLVQQEALQELEALECEMGRINKRLATLKELLKAA